MCQMNVVVMNENIENETIENVTRVESVDGGVTINSLFEDIKFIPNAHVKKIDMSANSIIISSNGG